ncbi:MAG: Hpt domain-containing protein [Rickettsiales bacterium]|nr:Hpt domain-containing protein [Pseudomonadota bacterium]MDA0966208.1 Hpt domain-containing protein [Pseudomonadota bacterium]MDG4543127.1 Hpt domain-containing protein [Rickettsiales bacterium]MDG4545325.1 Hpt domain-containing protein [Rickettsiales bacterium]MDG4547774.1 Hpt domain-containing protein [Rickettsiales bacterium]
MLHLINEKKYLKIKQLLEDDFSSEINNFFKDSSIYIVGIQNGIESKDCLKIQSLAHTMKNTANEFGAEIVSDIADKIESEAHSMMIDEGGNIEEIKDLFGELESSFQASREKMKKLIG